MINKKIKKDGFSLPPSVLTYNHNCSNCIYCKILALAELEVADPIVYLCLFDTKGGKKHGKK